MFTSHQQHSQKKTTLTFLYTPTECFLQETKIAQAARHIQQLLCSSSFSLQLLENEIFLSTKIIRKSSTNQQFTLTRRVAAQMSRIYVQFLTFLCSSDPPNDPPTFFL